LFEGFFLYIPSMKAIPYNSFSSFLKQRYGEKVWKVGIDAGFSCPNRDAHGKEGCLFCRNDSFNEMRFASNMSVAQQMQNGIELAQNRFGIQKYIAYFQTSTNTFAPVSQLCKIYNEALQFPNVVGLSISTRPDCLNPAVIDLIQELSTKVDVWVELGLQSIFDRTLESLNRGHTLSDYDNAVSELEKLNVRICTHTMIGLPGENQKDIRTTANYLAHQPIHEVKIHPLLILNGTPLAVQYQNRLIDSLPLDDYVTWVCDFIERLHPSFVIQRLTAEAPAEILLAPEWSLNKLIVINKIRQEFQRRGTKQGDLIGA